MLAARCRAEAEVMPTQGLAGCPGRSVTAVTDKQHADQLVRVRPRAGRQLAAGLLDACLFSTAKGPRGLKFGFCAAGLRTLRTEAC